MLLKFQALHPDFKLPHFATEGAAAFDLVALSRGHVGPGRIAKVPLGFAVEIPDGYAMFITGRSGNGFNYGVGVPQGYGLIDSDYRGEVSMVLTSEKVFGWLPGDRIGQAVVMPVLRPDLMLVSELSGTDRGVGGFGSTGVGCQ